MASITVPSVSTLPVAGADIIAEPLKGWLTNIRSFIEGNNIDRGNVNYTDPSVGIATLADAQTFTALKTLSNVEDASGGVRTGLIVTANPATGTAADNDGIELQFKGDNDNGDQHIYGEIECVFTDVSNGNEDAIFNFKTYTAGAEVVAFSVGANTSAVKSVAAGHGSVQTLATYEWDPSDGSNLTDNSSGIGISFKMPDDADNQHVYANLDVICVADNNGSEKGEFSFKVAASGASAEKMTLSTDALTVTPKLVLSTVSAAGEDTDKFLVLDSSGNVDYRTGAQVASDIGAVSSSTQAVTAVNNATANELVTIGSTTTELDAEANLTYDDTNGLILQSATASKPVFTIQNTNDGATSGTLKFVNDKGGVGANNDVCGTIDFYGDDANQDQVNFAKIEGIVANATNGQEGGKLAFSVASHDGESNVGFFITDGSVEDEVDATIGNGSASVTTIAGTLTMGSTAAMTNAGLLSVADQSNITGLGTISSGTWQGTKVASAYLDDDTAHLSGSTFTGAVTVGVDGTGHDFKCFGDNSGAFMLYDADTDSLEIRGKETDSAPFHGLLKLTTAMVDLQDNDKLGAIEFSAPAETQTGDARLVSARIHAEAEATYTATVNTTALVFSTGTSEEAAEKFRITGAGAFTGAGDIESTSDIRTKENIKPIENALEIVSKIRGVTFNKKDTPDKESVGVIAQEVEEAGLTQAVSENHEGMKTVAYGNMVGLLIEAIKDQQKQIDDLKARL